MQLAVLAVLAYQINLLDERLDLISNLPDDAPAGLKQEPSESPAIQGHDAPVLNEDGDCNRIDVSTQSFYLPLYATQRKK
jgi:hypothetical protein